MHRICIIGGGFAGLTAARRLSLSGLAFEGILIDKKQTSDFLPALPDCLGRGIDPDCLSYPIEDICRVTGFKFINEEVISIDVEKKEISTKNRVLNYDFLIIASGSETNFYGNENIRKHAYKLDDAEDAKNIAEKLNKGSFGTYIIGGGGYTGVEVATNLAIFLSRKKISGGKVIIVERSGSILGPLPEWMKGYVSRNLKQLNVDIFLNTQIEKIEGENVYISGGRVFDNSLVIWAAGVKTADFIQNLKAKKNPQARIEVDEYLRLNRHCFVIGDASYVRHKDIYLRMAVQFAIAEGGCAAQNVINTIKDKRLNKYRPVDLGYIIPMANNTSCGKIIGIEMKGFLPIIFHFAMCIYRLTGWKKKLDLLKGLIKKRRSMFKKISAFVLVGLMSLNMYGCVALLAGGAAGAGTAVWLSGKLTQEFHAPYERTINAAEAALKSLKLEITKESKEAAVTQLKSKYIDGKDIWIDVRMVTENSTKVEIRVGAVNPDKQAADKILKSIQGNL